MGQAAILSHGLFVGMDTTSPTASPVQLYQDRCNHATAAASIVSLIAARAGYVPRSAQGELSAVAHARFLDQLLDFPTIQLLETGQQRAHVQDRASLELMIAATYPFEEAAEVAHLLVDMIPKSVVDHHALPPHPWLLSLLVLKKQEQQQPAAHHGHDRGRHVTLLLVELALHLNYSHGSQVDLPEQDVTLSLTYLEVVDHMLIQHAETLASFVPTVSVPAFEALMTSPSFLKHAQPPPIDNAQRVLLEQTF